MKIIDSHLHLNEKLNCGIDTAVRDLDNQLLDCSILRGVVLHLVTQPWGYQEFGEAVEKSKYLQPFVNIDPYAQDRIKILEDAVKNFGYIGLKLHPRLQKFNLSDRRVAELCQIAGDLKIPVLIDAFPDGDWLMNRFHVTLFSDLAQACSSTRFIWAHFGGHNAIVFMMVAKRLTNVYLDISYSWLYYNGSSVIRDMSYAMKSMKYTKVFYGSDFPDRTIEQSLTMSLANFSEMQFAKEDLEKIMFENARDFFNWNDL